MYNEEPIARRFYAVSYTDDEPTVSLGAFIPRSKKTTPTSQATQRSQKSISFTPQIVNINRRNTIASPYVATVKIVTVFLSVALLLFVSLLSAPFIKETGGSFLAQIFAATQSSAPVIVENPYTQAQTELNYGVQMSFSQPNFFAETRNAFIAQSKTFVEADLTTMQLRYFNEGILELQVPIVAKGAKGSWLETPAGLYEVKAKKEKLYSTFGQMYTPWSITFQGNFIIHGWPYTESGEKVPTEFQGGGIRLSDADAKAVYELVTAGTPILVHEVPSEPDEFVYEPKIPELDTPHYLIADVETNTVLASSDLDSVAPIASLTKLMTALVAAEYINLDARVSVVQPTFVQSLIPRLSGLGTVSMYSLLQLLLVESSNEAAEVIAAQVGREKFIEHMNEKAKAIGLQNTQFADPSGLSAGNASTVRDLLGLIKYIYTTRQFIVDLTANQDLPTAYVSGEFGTLSNFNEVEGLDNFIGGKIGETTAAGQTSVTLHKITVKGDERVIAIVLLGSDSRNADVTELLGYATARFGS
ncbi:L,D-transpeptidase family protein [Patescibacteria group bacterium]|nr:L,D-transpeptidase family protein [Patescibacteria group bacterium]